MTDLSPQLQKLVTAAKDASRPSAAAEARVHEALIARLGESAFVVHGITTTGAGAAAPTLALKTAALSMASIALMGGAAWLYWNAQKAPAAPRIEIRESVAPSALSAPSGEPRPSVEFPTSPELSTPVALETKPTPASSTGVITKGRARDRLAEEVALISRAQSEISSARAASALTLLDEHARKFPNGILRDERIAARIQALCALGRTVEADAQLNRLSPRSLHHRGQTQSACGAQPRSTLERTAGSKTSKP